VTIQKYCQFNITITSNTNINNPGNDDGVGIAFMSRMFVECTLCQIMFHSK